MPTIDFEFRARGAAQVKENIDRIQNAARQAGRTTTALSQAETRMLLREIAIRDRARAKAADEARKSEARITAAVREGASDREKAAARETDAKVRAFRAAVRAHESAERAMSATTERESRRRAVEQNRQRTRRGAAASQAAQQGFGMAVGVAGSLHGQFQDARRRTAATETTLNTMFGQTGASESEIPMLRRRFMERMRERHIDVGAAAGALGYAQSRFNALGGDSPVARMVALEQSMRDLDFANTIDPTQLGGLPAFSAMLRQQNISGDLRSEILRNVTGISFSGSVETEEALQRGLPGMLRALSSNLANAPAAQRDETIRNTVTDFMAQLQTVAATGGGVTVSANRMGTLRTALNNAHNQDRIGRALAARRMTDEQRAEFNQAFTRDRSGRYVMNEALRNSPSNAAALFGHLFNNDATALSNFMGTHGGGGRQQLLQKNIVDLLGSYFATGTNAQGRTMRQYELEGELRQQTLTPERLAELQRIRDQESRAGINDEDNARDAALTDNTSALKQLSDRLAMLTASNPVAATILGAAAPLVGGKVLGAVAKGIFGAGGGGGGAAAGAGAAGGGVLATALLGGGALAATGTALAWLNNDVSRSTGTTTRQRAGAFLSGVDAQTALGAATDARIEAIGREADRVTANRNWNPGVLGAAGAPPVIRLAPESVEGLARAMAAMPAPALSPQTAAHAATIARVEASHRGNRT